MGGKGSGNPKGSSGRRPTVPGGLVRVDTRLSRQTIEQLRRHGALSQVLRGLAERQAKMDAIKIGDRVRVKPHIVEQHLLRGAVINPPKLHRLAGGEIGTVTAVFEEGVEVELKVGDIGGVEIYAPDWLEVIDVMAELAEQIYSMVDGADHKQHHAEQVQRIYEWLAEGNTGTETRSTRDLAAEWQEFENQT